MSVYGRIAKIEFTIVRKLKETGANSTRTAVTPEEAKFDFEEIGWLEYFAGGALSNIKKTKGGGYYI